jgi:hypothetical protein
VTKRECSELPSAAGVEWITANHQAGNLEFSRLGKGRLQLAIRAGIENVQFNFQVVGRRFQIVQYIVRASRIGLIDEHGKCRLRREEFSHQLKSLRPEPDIKNTDARCVAAWSIETCSNTGFDRVKSRHEDNGNGSGRRPSCACARAIRDDCIHLTLHEISSQGRQPVGSIFRKAELNHDILALDKARLF